MCDKQDTLEYHYKCDRCGETFARTTQELCESEETIEYEYCTCGYESINVCDATDDDNDDDYSDCCVSRWKLFTHLLARVFTGIGIAWTVTIIAHVIATLI